MVASQPQLLAEHAEAYAELFGEELGAATAQWKRKAVLSAVALCGVGVSTVLAGVALMLWAVIPPADIQAPWALIVAPLLPLLVAGGCLLMAQTPPGKTSFGAVREQVRADMAMLRSVSAS
ncbi:MAG: hypothetical protein H7Y33_11430 [Cytophagales bacterium]|nr:hypothetical protein [Rhizobacter sp.]